MFEGFATLGWAKKTKTMWYFDKHNHPSFLRLRMRPTNDRTKHDIFGLEEQQRKSNIVMSCFASKRLSTVVSKTAVESGILLALYTNCCSEDYTGTGDSRETDSGYRDPPPPAPRAAKSR